MPTEQELQDFVLEALTKYMESLNEEGDESEALPDVKDLDIRPYDECGVLTSNKGMVVKLRDKNGKEICGMQLTIVRV